jgi:hypothetical protein
MKRYYTCRQTCQDVWVLLFRESKEMFAIPRAVKDACLLWRGDESSMFTTQVIGRLASIAF